MKPFEKIFSESDIILTEGALVERLKAEFNIKMDDQINHAGLIYSKPNILKFIYSQYIDIAEKNDLSILIMTPTRKVNLESQSNSIYKNHNLIEDSIFFLNQIRKSYGDFSKKVFIGGLLGCKGDAYSGIKVFNIDQAFSFHKNQTKLFNRSNVDFLFAGIMPELNEAIGMAKAMAETELPYIISFMINKNGRLLDGTTISDAIKIIDRETERNPIIYMANCIHPSNLIKALQNQENLNRKEIKRFGGIQANASVLSHDELNNCGILHQDDFNVMTEEMIFLKNNYGFKIFGGCCGTNEKFIEYMSKKLIQN